jgi:multidrug efflux pump subunit AcrA (membrane-fusion protein)
MTRNRTMCVFVIMYTVMAQASQEPWTFRAGRGLTLTEKTASVLGLQVAVAESGEGARVWIPRTALLETVRGEAVYTRNGAAWLRVPVKIGERQAERVEVLDGLFEGDEVVSAATYELWLIELQAVNGGRGCADGH